MTEPVERHTYLPAINEYSMHFCEIQGHEPALGLDLGHKSAREAS